MTPFKSLLKSKKGGIPVINEIVITLNNIIPTPIKIMLFLFLIGVIGSVVMPTLLSFFGYNCVQAGDGIRLYQVPMAKIIDNAYLQFQQGLFNLLGILPYQLPETPFPNGDRHYLKIPTACFVNSKVNTSAYGYSAGCVNCVSDQTNIFQTLWISRRDMICTSDGYAFDRVGGVIPDLIAFCNQCSPPYPYYFNHTVCLNNTVINDGECYFTLLSNISVSSVEVANFDTTGFLTQIIAMGGVVRPQDSSELVNVQCEQANQPQLYFFSIKILDLKLWSYLFIGFGLITFAYWYYNIMLH